MKSYYRDSLKVEVNVQIEQISRELDAYKELVSVNLISYIKLMEAINIIITDSYKNSAR